MSHMKLLGVVRRVMPSFLTNQARVLPGASQAAGDGLINATALVIRVENRLFQLAHVADPSRAGAQFCGYDCAEVQARGRPVDKYFQQSRILVTSRRGNETVGIQYELLHGRRSIDPRELQFSQCSNTTSQLTPKSHKVKRHFDRLTFGGRAQILLSPP